MTMYLEDSPPGNVRDVRSRHVRRDPRRERCVIDCANRSCDVRISGGASFRRFDCRCGRECPRARCDVRRGRGSATVGAIWPRDAIVRCFRRSRRLKESSTLAAGIARICTRSSSASRCRSSSLRCASRVGAAFFRSGLLKVNSWEFAVQLFRDEYKVPLLDPVLAAQARKRGRARRAAISFRRPRDTAGDFATARDDRRHSDLRLPERMERPPAVGLDPGVPVDARPRSDIARPSDRDANGLRLRQSLEERARW